MTSIKTFKYIMRNLILFGAPGSGKGTQSKFLAEHYGIEHISTGDLLREEVAKGGELAEEINALISVGKLVPDEMILTLLFEHINAIEDFQGLILDGFPRTVVQAEKLIEEFEKRSWPLPLLVDMEVHEDELMQRLLERGKVSGRSDDNKETIQKRFTVYHQQSEPVIKHFQKTESPLVVVNGIGTIEEITSKLITAIDDFYSK